MYLGQQTAEINIADKYKLLGLHHVEIKKSVHQTIQTAKLELPLSVVIRNNELLKRIKLSDKISEGDKITIAFGYNGNNKIEFEGYIKRTNYAMPFVLECEDELYLLRKLNLKKSFGKCTLKELMEWLLSEMNKVKAVDWILYDKMPELALTNFIIPNKNGIEVLEMLRPYGQYSYLTTINGRKVLYVGLVDGLVRDDVKYVFNTNTIDTEELKYNSGEKKNYKTTIINFNRNGTKTTVTVGDKDGQTQTVYSSGDHSEADLKIMGEAYLKKITGNGYKGNMECFLFPFIEPGNIAVLSDPQFPERAGRHYVGTVTTTFGTQGGRRNPEIDYKTA